MIILSSETEFAEEMRCGFGLMIPVILTAYAWMRTHPTLDEGIKNRAKELATNYGTLYDGLPLLAKVTGPHLSMAAKGLTGIMDELLELVKVDAFAKKRSDEMLITMKRNYAMHPDFHYPIVTCKEERETIITQTNKKPLTL